MALNSKNKGNNYELKISKVLSKWWGETFQRTPASGGLQWKQDNRISGDIVIPEGSSYPWTVECKKREAWTWDNLMKGTGEIQDWWEQASKDANKVSKLPMLIFSKNYAPDYVMIQKDASDSLIAACPAIGKLNRFNIYVSKVEPRTVYTLNEFVAVVKRETVEQVLASHD